MQKCELEVCCGREYTYQVWVTQSCQHAHFFETLFRFMDLEYAFPCYKDPTPFDLVH